MAESETETRNVHAEPVAEPFPFVSKAWRYSHWCWSLLGKPCVRTLWIINENNTDLINQMRMEWYFSFLTKGQQSYTSIQSMFFLSINKPCCGIMALFVLRNLVLQARMRNHPMAARCLLFGRTLCLIPCFVSAGSECSGETARMRMLAWAFVSRLRGCACSPEPSLVGYVISAIISWAGSVIQRPDVVFTRTGLPSLRDCTDAQARLSLCWSALW